MSDEDLAKAMSALYREHDLNFEEESIKDMLACIKGIRIYLRDIGFIIGDDILSISSVNNNKAWIRAKLQMVKVVHG